MQYVVRRELVPVGVEDRRFLVRPGETRRKSQRQRTLLTGYVAPQGGGQLVEVMVRNLSDGGARLSLKGPSSPGDEFLLCIPTRGIASPVRLIWREGVDLGVAFEAADEAGSARCAAILASLQR